MRLTFGVQGVDKVIAEMKKLSLEKRAQIRAAVNETAVNIQRNAKRACPVDTGRLRSSIRMEFYSNGLAAEVFTNVKYAPYVEFGTGMRGAASKKPPGMPSVDYTLSWPGMPARPFLFPAAEQERRKFEERIKKILGSSIGSVGQAVTGGIVDTEGDE